MTIRCPECGYENRDMYRFCGMCGATLRREGPAEATVSEPPAAKPESPKPAPDLPEPSESPVDLPMPSFITGEPAPRNLDYLLEDDAPKSHGKLVITLLLLVLAAGLMVWHWRRDGYPWASSGSSTPQTTATSTSPQPPNATPGSQPVPAPANSAPTNAAPASAAKPSTPETQPALTPALTPAPATEPPPQATAKETQPQAEPTADNAASSNAKPGAAADNSSSDERQPAPAIAKPAPPPPPKAKSEPKPAASAAPALTGDDKLVADGEKYLYGNGVPENCDLAEKNLRTAAGHSNARALTLMGAMYATGHCVTRDLPTAYRWFAKALHQDPSNGRVQQDLEILWKQMTPEEKQLATKSGG